MEVMEVNKEDKVYDDVMLSVQVNQNLRDRVKLLSVKTHKTVRTIVNEAIEEYLKKYENTVQRVL